MLYHYLHNTSTRTGVFLLALACALTLSSVATHVLYAEEGSADSTEQTNSSEASQEFTQESTSGNNETTNESSSESSESTSETDGSNGSESETESDTTSESQSTEGTQGEDGTGDDTETPETGDSTTNESTESTESTTSEEESATSENSNEESNTEESATTETQEQTSEGGEGSEGENTGGQTVESDSDASLTTGDATNNADITNEQNTNDVDVDAEAETNVDTDNVAQADNTADVSSGTGNNTATVEGDVTITSGSAISTANVLNVLNTNTFNSHGLMYFLNMLMGNVAVDLRSLFSVLTGGTPNIGSGTACSLEDEACSDPYTSLTIDNNNDGTVNNDVNVGATTGGNTATAEDGNADVASGDARAAANIVNVVNTNITNANYLLLTMNGFAEGAGDIVFPGAEWFTNLLLGGGSVPAGSTVNYENENTATVTTEGTVGAESGNNQVAAGGDATVDSGDATAQTTIVDRINTTIFGDSLSFLFRVPSDWSGSVYGLPEGMNWREAAGGIEIFWDNEDTDGAPVTQDDLLSVRNTNNAEINNRFNVFALTGDNAVEADGDASVSSGDAEASANVVNVVNTNVLGRNWVMAIFNILGDWQGDITFGQSDLWVGARAVAPKLISGGSCFNYEVTVNNFGDAVAENVVLESRFDSMIQRMDGFTEDFGDRMEYMMGRIPAGGTRTVSFPTCLERFVNPQSEVTTEFTVSSANDNDDAQDNSELITIVTGTGAGKPLTPNPELTIAKTVSERTIYASTSVTYTITIENGAAPLYNAVLMDTIYNEDEQKIHEQQWELDRIYPNETITVEYTAHFNDVVEPGTYTNEAYVLSTEEDVDPDEDMHIYETEVVSVAIEVIEDPEAPVEEQAIEALNTCKPLITEYIKRGDANNSQEVRKLQFFLMNTEDMDNVPLSGFYDDATYDAVHAFQTKYASDILNPWGVAQSTGYVYYTTQKKINELWCMRDFPLSDTQKSEIAAFRDRVNAAEESGSNLPQEEYELIGAAPAPAALPTSTDEPSMLAMDAPVPTPIDTTPPAPTQTAPVREQSNDQVAAASEAADGAGNLWATVRNGVNSFLNWF